MRTRGRLEGEGEPFVAIFVASLTAPREDLVLHGLASSSESLPGASQERGLNQWPCGCALRSQGSSSSGTAVSHGDRFVRISAGNGPGCPPQAALNDPAYAPQSYPQSLVVPTPLRRYEFSRSRTRASRIATLQLPAVAATRAVSGCPAGGVWRAATRAHLPKDGPLERLCSGSTLSERRPGCTSGADCRRPRSHDPLVRPSSATWGRGREARSASCRDFP